MHGRARPGARWRRWPWRRRVPACPDKNVHVLAGLPARRRVRPVGAPPAGGAQEEVPGHRHHHPVQGRRRRRADVVADEPAARRRRQRRRRQPAAHRVPADRGPGAVQDRRTSRRCSGSTSRPTSWWCPSQSPIKTFQDFLKAAKANPGKLSLGGSGLNSANHAAHERLDAAFGIKTHLRAVQGHGRHGDRRCSAARSTAR